MRYWFGVRLILITILYFIVSNVSTHNPYLALTIQHGFMVGYAFLQIFLQPFKQRSIAILDMSFILNLMLLTIGTSYIQRDDGRMEDQSVLVALSVSIAFVTFVGILVYHIGKRLYSIRVVKMRTDSLFEKAKEHYQRGIDKTKNFYRRLKSNKREDILDVREISELMAMHDMAPQVPVYRHKPKSKSENSRRSPSSHPPSLFVSDVESDNELREPVLDFVDHQSKPKRNHSLPVGLLCQPQGMQYLNAPNAVALALHPVVLCRSASTAGNCQSTRSSPTTSYVTIEDSVSSPDDIELRREPLPNIRHTS